MTSRLVLHIACTAARYSCTKAEPLKVSHISKYVLPWSTNSIGDVPHACGIGLCLFIGLTPGCALSKFTTAALRSKFVQALNTQERCTSTRRHLDVHLKVRV
jgi:hypothetical protein